jgi:hypothetical protein
MRIYLALQHTLPAARRRRRGHQYSQLNRPYSALRPLNPSSQHISHGLFVRDVDSASHIAGDVVQTEPIAPGHNVAVPPLHLHPRRYDPYAFSAQSTNCKRINDLYERSHRKIFY